MNKDLNLFNFPMMRLKVYVAALFGVFLLGVFLKVFITDTPPPTRPATTQELLELKAPLRGHSPP
jgi:hypothetical protein